MGMLKIRVYYIELTLVHTRTEMLQHVPRLLADRSGVRQVWSRAV